MRKGLEKNGYITFIALWLGMLSILLAFGMYQSARHDYRLARVEADEVSAFYCAESGMIRFRDKLRATRTQEELLRLVDLKYTDCPCPEQHRMAYWFNVPEWWTKRVDGTVSVSAIQKTRYVDRTLVQDVRSRNDENGIIYSIKFSDYH